MYSLKIQKKIFRHKLIIILLRQNKEITNNVTWHSYFVGCEHGDWLKSQNHASSGAHFPELM